MGTPLVMGVDVAGRGVRVVVALISGQVVADIHERLARPTTRHLPPGHFDQEPADWWNATRICLQRMSLVLSQQNHKTDEIVAGAIGSMAGEIVLLDEENRPLHSVSLREGDCVREARNVNSASAALRGKLALRFDASFALPKILWIARHEPELWERTRRVASIADYIAGKLTGVFDVTAPSHALGMGFDPIDFQWSPFIEGKLGIDVRRFPRVVRMGEPVAKISKACAEETGLNEATHMVAGITDDLADQIASGARHIGDWNSFFGESLTFRGVTRHVLRDPQERVYCYLHPLGYWMPRVASGVGTHGLVQRFPKAKQARFNRAALALSPTPLAVYPVAQQDERFPFNKPAKVGFVQGKSKNDREFYAAHLEGIAFVERYGYNMLRSLGAEMRERIYTTGDGLNRDEWMQIRANVMGVEFARAANANAAMGCAIVAASQTFFRDVTEAGAQMTRIDRVISPRAAATPRYEEGYQRFLAACQRRGYLSRR